MDLGAYRETLLRAAAIGVKKWCCPPEELVDGRRRSDTFWMLLFTDLDQKDVTKDEAHLFLVTFQLTNRVSWEKEKVAEAIKRLRDSRGFDPLTGVPELSKVLAECNTRKTRQTSAASKIATFTKPDAQVFIWDKLASRAARYRDWHRDGRVGRLRSAPYLNGKDHDYPAYYAACARALDDERRRPDFVATLTEVVDHFRAGTGPMADREIVDDGFIERRLLDKLMFAEGWVLNRKLPPPDSWTSGEGM